MSHECSVENREPVIKSLKFMADLFDAVSAPAGKISERVVNHIWMDSRKVEEGDLFVALSGEDVDGHDFVEQALASGAAAALVAETEVGRYPLQVREQLIVVKNTLLALQHGAREYRRILNIPFIAITGSNGKTSTAHFLREILSTSFTVGSTHGNFNNHIGLPLSIFRFTGMEDVAVLEMGANHPGEIEELAAIAEPDMGVITNIGYAHVGEFGSIEKTAAAKFELAQAIHSIGGILYLNGDDRISVEKNIEMEIPALYCGGREHNSVRAENVGCSAEGCYFFDLHGYRFELSIPGKHFMYNLLPALAIAFRLNIVPEILQEKTKEIAPADLRGTIRMINGVRYIEDCYNANPSSMKVAAELLRDIPTAGRRIAVAGDMYELGAYSEALHEECGAFFHANSTDILIAVGNDADSVLTGARDNGADERTLFAVKSVRSAAEVLLAHIKPGDLVLLKGSRGVGLEEIIPLLENGVEA